MKLQITSLSLFRSALFFLAIIFAGTAAAAKSVNTTFFGNLAIKGYDPVAYFIDGKAVKGSKSHSIEWNGAKWRFSSAENLEKFQQEPEKYAPQYGGYCAWAVSQNKTADIDPDQFAIVEGKLYLNYNAKIQKRWLQQQQHFIDEADKFWPELVEE